jgi:hypothetical protein
MNTWHLSLHPAESLHESIQALDPMDATEEQD